MAARANSEMLRVPVVKQKSWSLSYSSAERRKLIMRLRESDDIANAKKEPPRITTYKQMATTCLYLSAFSPRTCASRLDSTKPITNGTASVKLE